MHNWTNPNDGDRSRRFPCPFVYGRWLKTFALAGGMVVYCLAATVAAGTQGPAKRTPPLVFEGVGVVDVLRGKVLLDQRVVILGRQILAVGDRRKVRLPVGAVIVDARSQYVVPGLWDMHVYAGGTRETPRMLYEAFVVGGVTGIRDMGTPYLDSLRRWRSEIAVGTRIGPRVMTGGPSVRYVDSVQWTSLVATHDQPAHFIGVWSAKEGRRVVDSLKRAGADFLSIDPTPEFTGNETMPRDVYLAILGETRRLNFPVAGERPVVVSAVEASDSGQLSFEHLMLMMNGPKDSSFLADCWQADTLSGDRRCAALAARFVHNNSWVTPVISEVRSAERKIDEMEPGADQDVARRSLNLIRERLHRLQRFGLPLLAGSGLMALNPSPEPEYALRMGSEIHEELATFVRAGLTSIEALRTATLNPAQYFRATDTLGAIAPGHLADLLVVDANPLVDIRNTRKIRAVVANGRYFDRRALDSLMVDITQRLTMQRPSVKP